MDGVKDMFVLTAKFNRKKAIAIVLALAVLLILIILIAANTGKKSNNANSANEAAALSAVVKNNEQRVNYLNALGWEVEKNALEEQKVMIPREMNDVYADYNTLQKAQGFDLSKFGGLEAMRYTYKVLNYPDAAGTVVADIIVYRNEVIAGDIQSNALDGFMVGLEYPKTDTFQTASTGDALTDDSQSGAAMMPTEVPENTAGVLPSSDNAAENTADNSTENTADNNASDNNAADGGADGENAAVENEAPQEDAA